jgi:hypothetical protein
MRHRLNIALLAFVLGAAALWAAFDAGNRVETPIAAKTGDPPRAGSDGLRTGLPARAAFGDATAELFAPRAQEAPSSSMKRGRTSPPDAPPLPYRFIGRVYQESGTQIFLAKDAKVFAVKKGDVLDGAYRVDAVSSTSLTLIHLASGARQVMQFTLPIEDESRIARDAPDDTTWAASGSAPEPQAAPSRPALLNWNDMLTLERRAHAAPARLE